MAYKASVLKLLVGKINSLYRNDWLMKHTDEKTDDQVAPLTPFAVHPEIVSGRDMASKNFELKLVRKVVW